MSVQTLDPKIIKVIIVSAYQSNEVLSSTILFQRAVSMCVIAIITKIASHFMNSSVSPSKGSPSFKNFN